MGTGSLRSAGIAGGLPAAAVTSSRGDEVLRHHAFQGPTNDCGPYCVAMVVAAIGGGALGELGPADRAERTARAMDRPFGRGSFWRLRRIPRGPTFPWGLQQQAGESGLPSRWLIAATAAELRSCLRAGQLPIVLLGGWGRRPWAHWSVLLAWEPRRGWGLGDPGWPQAELHWIAPAEFERCWRAMGRQAVVVRAGESASNGSA
jgi:hypothetical protein